MCVVCIDWQKGSLTVKEALRNLGEMASGTEDSDQRQHYFEVVEKILDEEDRS